MPVVDIWAEPSAQRPQADVLVAPELVHEFEQLLREAGIQELELLKHNIQHDLDQERSALLRHRRSARRHRRHLPEGASNFPLDDFHGYAAIVAHLRRLERQFPHLARLFSVGRTFEGRELVGIRISAPEDSRPEPERSTPKPAVFIDAGIHAREWIAPAVALSFLDKLLVGAQHDPELARLAQEVDWFVLPVMNPDGYVHSFTKVSGGIAILWSIHFTLINNLLQVIAYANNLLLINRQKF